MDTRHGLDTQDQAVTIRLEIEPGDPPAGILTRAGHVDQTRFHGWISLLAAITEARRPAHPDDKPSADLDSAGD